MTPDPELCQAIGELKAAVSATPTGRVFVEIHTLAGAVVEHRLRRDRCTEEEIRRLMSQRPCPREARMETARRRR